MFFMMWRFQKRLEHYSGLKGPFYGGEYSRCGHATAAHVCLFASVAACMSFSDASRMGRAWPISERVLAVGAGASGANRNLLSVRRILQCVSVGRPQSRTRTLLRFLPSVLWPISVLFLRVYWTVPTLFRSVLPRSGSANAPCSPLPPRLALHDPATVAPCLCSRAVASCFARVSWTSNAWHYLSRICPVFCCCCCLSIPPLGTSRPLTTYEPPGLCVLTYMPVLRLTYSYTALMITFRTLTVLVQSRFRVGCGCAFVGDSGR